MPEENFIIPADMVKSISFEDSVHVILLVKNGFKVKARKDQFTDFNRYKNFINSNS